ncbi:acyl carrier protein [Listeria monocytogenes]|nr:acyl carrier protein [Listeria monocytogenes]GAM95479.1 acyl carrier protein [Listeria monocytogenes]
MYFTASPTVLMFSASPSEISTPNSSSSSITNSTTSRESAPRSSLKEASKVTLDSSTPKRSTMIFVTFSNTSAIFHFTSLQVLYRIISPT